MWSTYALHIATFTSLSFVFDPLIIILTHKLSQGLPGNGHFWAMFAQLAFMAWIKIIKLIGLFRREPMDIIFLPVSIVFGYFHGLIKIYALLTHRVVRQLAPLSLCIPANHLQTSWGSREDGDTNDNERMSPRGRRSESITLPPGNHPGLIRYNDKKSFPDEKIFSSDEKAAVSAIEIAVDSDSDSASDSDMLDAKTDDSDDSYDHDDSASNSSSTTAMDTRGR